MQYYESEDMPYMSFSRTGLRENEQGHAFLGMGDRHKERLYAIRMLLYFWDTHPDTVVYIDGQELHPTDEEFAEAQEGSSKPELPVVRSESPSMPEALVSASVQVEQALHEEDAPRRESIRAIAARARAQTRKAKPCKKGSRLRALMT
jgi:hypothetical protein